MLREKNRMLLRFQRAADIMITAGSFIAAYFIKRNLLPEELSGLSTGPNYYMILLLIIIIWYLSFH